MSTTSDITTAEQLACMASDEHRYELIQGVLRMMSPAGNLHGRVTSNIHWRLDQHVHLKQLGIVYAAETGFVIQQNPDTVRAPDVAFVSSLQLDQMEDTAGYLRLAPDLVVEVVSPSDTFSEVEETSLAWLDAGAAIVLLADAGTKTFHVYRSPTDIQLLTAGEVLDAGDVVTDWKLAVDDAFE